MKIEEYISNNKEKFCSIDELDLQVDASAFYPSLEPYYNTGDIPFIRVADVKDRIDYDICIKIPQMNDAFKTLYKRKAGDIVLTKGGRIGTPGLITKDSYVTRDLIFIDSSKLKKNDYVSLYLYLCSNFCYKQLLRSSSMTAQPHLTITLTRNLPVFKFSEDFKSCVTNLYELSTCLYERSIVLYNEAKKTIQQSFDCLLTDKIYTSKLVSESFFISGRLDAEYYHPKYDSIFNSINMYDITTIAQSCFIYKNNCNNYSEDKKEVGVIKTKQLTNSEIKIDSVESFLDFDIAKQNNCCYLKNNDIVFASMGVGSLGKVCIYVGDDDRYVTDSTLKIYRMKPNTKINPEYLCLFLQSEIGQELIYRYVVGSTGIINIYDSDMNNIPIPILDEVVQNDIALKVQESFKLRKKSKQLLEYAKQAVEIAVEQGEGVATNWLLNKEV